jgi:hypothetical protein
MQFCFELKHTIMPNSNKNVFKKLEHTNHNFLSTRTQLHWTYSIDFFFELEHNRLPNRTITFFILELETTNLFAILCRTQTPKTLFISTIKVSNSNTSNDFIRTPRTQFFVKLETTHRNWNGNVSFQTHCHLVAEILTKSTTIYRNTYMTLQLSNNGQITQMVQKVFNHMVEFLIVALERNFVSTSSKLAQTTFRETPRSYAISCLIYFQLCVDLERYFISNTNSSNTILCRNLPP